MNSLKTVVLAVCCVVLLGGNIKNGATVTDARFGCYFSLESRATGEGEGSDRGVSVSDSYLLSQGVYVRPQTDGSKVSGDSQEAEQGVPVSVSYLKSRGFDHVDRSVLQSSYFWEGCTLWYEDESPGTDSHLFKESSIKDGEFSFKDVVTAFEECKTTGGTAVLSATGSEKDKLAVHDVRCVHTLKTVDTTYKAPNRSMLVKREMDLVVKSKNPPERVWNP